MGGTSAVVVVSSRTGSGGGPILGATGGIVHGKHRRLAHLAAPLKLVQHLLGEHRLLRAARPENLALLGDLLGHPANVVSLVGGDGLLKVGAK